MNKVADIVERIKQLPEWGKTIGGIAATILTLVGLYSIYASNFPAFILIVFPLFIAIVILISLYFIFARGVPQFIGGRRPLIFGSLTRFVSIAALITAITSSTVYYTSPKGRVNVKDAIYGTSTPTSTNTSLPTPTSTSTLTSTPIPTATPKEQGIYYMIVLDASLKMQEKFETQTKWESALRAVDSILVGLEDEAHYGLVTIGGTSKASGSNPCDESALTTLRFSTKKAVGEQVAQLQPSGGGSLYQAFILAKKQFDGLPENTVHTLIYITGSEDACESEDEWAALERYFRIEGEAGLNIYSEIIIIDSKNGFRTQTIKDRLNSISNKVNAQNPQTVFQLLQTNNTVISNVTTYVNNVIAAIPTNTPTIAPIITSTKTALSITNISPSVIVTTITPSRTPMASPTWTPSLTPSLTSSPSPSVTSMPFVSLEFHGEYVPSGKTCIARIIVNVANGPVTGIFHVWNASYGPDGDPYDPYFFAIGTSDYWVGLGGDRPEYYEHKVWLEYNGTKTDPPLTGLQCPNMPTATP